jgi:replicative DNA helicase
MDIDNWKDEAHKLTKQMGDSVGLQLNKLVVSGQNLFVEDKGSQSCGFILNSIRKHMLNHRVDVVVVDYLQKLRYYGESAKKGITDIMERFCSFAKEHDIAFIVVSQLRRSDKAEPELNELKESGDIENFADVVVLLHRESIYRPGERTKGWYRIAKNRHGDTTDNVDLEYLERYLRFRETNVPSDGGFNTYTMQPSDEELNGNNGLPTEQSVMEDIKNYDKERGG